MRKVIYQSILIPILSLLFTSCSNEDKDSSPFGQLLSQPAYASLTDSINQQPKNDELYFKRAVLLNKNNFPEPALSDFQKAWSLSKQEKYAFGVTNVLLEKKPDSAILFLQEALKELPESYLLQLSLARAYAAQNKTDMALQVCGQLLQTHPDQPDALVLQADLLEQKGDLKNSIASLEKAFSLVRDNWDLASRLAYKYAENKDPRALSFSDSLIQKDSLKLFAGFFYVKGVYYSNINDNTNAIRFFDETIQRDHNYLNAYIEKGKVLLKQKKTTEALKVFSLLNTIKPSFADGWFWIGACQEELGRKEDARISYEKAYSLDKTFVEAKEAGERLGK
jgi:tetratricopeptide (TPR) repeat protein